MNDYDYDDDFGLEALIEKLEKILAQVPEGLDDYKYDDSFREQFDKDFARSGDDPQVIHDAFDQISLSRDNLLFSRYVRIKLKQMNKEDLYDTQEQYLDKDKKFAQSSYDSLTTLVVGLSGALRDTVVALRELSARITRALEARDARLDDLEARLAESEAKREEIERQWADRYGQAFEYMAQGRAAAAPAEEGKKKLSKKELAALKKQEEQQAAGAEAKSRQEGQEDYKADMKARSRAVAVAILIDEALVDRLLEGLPAIKDKVALWEYIERTLCIEAHVKYTTAYNDKLCEVYAANVGYATTAGTIHTQLGDYLRAGNAAGKF